MHGFKFKVVNFIYPCRYIADLVTDWSQYLESDYEFGDKGAKCWLEILRGKLIVGISLGGSIVTALHRQMSMFRFTL